MTHSKIRSVQLADLDSVIEIEHDSFPNPWDQSIFFQLSLSGGRFPVDEHTVVNMKVMEREGLVLGYIVWEEYHDDNHGHILNLAVHTDYQQQGNGQRLLNHAFASMKSSEIETCELEVRESNHWARHLYENAGMMAVDRRVGYYETENAIIYALTFD